MIGLQIDNQPSRITLDVKEYIGSGQPGESKDYNKLVNKPQINGVTLEGNKTLEELGIAPLEDYVIIQGTL